MDLNAARRVIRTVFAVAAPLAAIAPLIYQAALNQDPATATGLLGGVLAVAAGITRVLALPQVEELLKRFVPWLAAEPAALEPAPRRALEDEEPIPGDDLAGPDLDAHYVNGVVVEAPQD